MAHFDLFRAQIERIVLLRRDLDRDALLDLDAEAVQTVDLFRIVGQQTQLLCAEVLQDLPIQYSRRSGAKPSLTFASTVSKPCSCSS